MLINSSELRPAGFITLREVIPLASEAAVHVGRHRYRAGLHQLWDMVPKRFVLFADNDNEFRSRCEWIRKHHVFVDLNLQFSSQSRGDFFWKKNITLEVRLCQGWVPNACPQWCWPTITVHWAYPSNRIYKKNFHQSQIPLDTTFPTFRDPHFIFMWSFALEELLFWAKQPLVWWSENLQPFQFNPFYGCIELNKILRDKSLKTTIETCPVSRQETVNFCFIC